MYSNYNMGRNYQTMYRNPNFFYRNQQRNYDDRLVPDAFIAPFLLGGLAGYAFGRPNYYPYNYYNNFYYPPYPYYYY